MAPHHDTGTMLDEAIWRFHHNERLYTADIVLIRVFLRHWIDAPALDKAVDRQTLDELRRDVREIGDREDLSLWLSRAEENGLDPL